MDDLGIFCLQSTEKVLYPKAPSSIHPPGKTNVGNGKNIGTVQKILPPLEESSPTSNILVHLELERLASLLTIELKRELCTPDDASQPCFSEIK